MQIRTWHQTHAKRKDSDVIPDRPLHQITYCGFSFYRKQEAEFCNAYGDDMLMLRTTRAYALCSSISTLPLGH